MNAPGTKFWLAVGVAVAMVLIIVIYLLRVEKPELGIVALPFGVITVVVGGYFTANVAASGQAAKIDPPKTGG